MVQGARYRVQGCSRRRLRLRLRECGDECVGSELLQGARYRVQGHNCLNGSGIGQQVQ
jgi:hypothetical protein